MLIELVTEFIVEVLVKVICCFPGAAVRWIFLPRRKSYLSLLEDVEVNFLITLLIGFFIYGIVTLCKQYA
jgi:hypothetical protein